MLRKSKVKPAPLKRGRPEAYPEWADLVPGLFVITYKAFEEKKIRASVRNYNARHKIELRVWKTASGEIAVERIK
jgi:hypothetical protein